MSTTRAPRPKCLGCRQNPGRCIRHNPAAARPDWRGEWQRRKDQYVERVWLRMMRDQSGNKYYAYYTKTDGKVWGELDAYAWPDELPAGAELIAAEPIPNGSKAQIARWLDQYAGRLEVIPHEVYQ